MMMLIQDKRMQNTSGHNLKALHTKEYQFQLWDQFYKKKKDTLRVKVIEMICLG